MNRIYQRIGFAGLWNGLPVRIVMIGTLTGLQWYGTLNPPNPKLPRWVRVVVVVFVVVVVTTGFSGFSFAAIVSLTPLLPVLFYYLPDVCPP